MNIARSRWRRVTRLRALTPRLAERNAAYDGLPADRVALLAAHNQEERHV